MAHGSCTPMGTHEQRQKQKDKRGGQRARLSLLPLYPLPFLPPPSRPDIACDLMAFENRTKERTVREDEASICPNATLQGVWKTSDPARLTFSTTLYSRHLLRIRGTCSTFEAAVPYSKYQICIQGICSVSDVPASCVQHPLCIQNLSVPPHTQRLICTFPFCPGGEALESQLRCPPHPPFRFRPSSVLHSMQRRAFAPTWAHTSLFRFCKFPILASRSCCFHAKHFPLLFLYVPSLIFCFHNTSFPANRTWHLSKRELCCRRRTYDEGDNTLNAARELHLAIPAAKGIGAKANRG